MKLKLTTFAGIALVAIGFNRAYAQAEKQDDFTKTRKTDFTKLIGGVQEGAKVNYSSDKTTLEGSGGSEIKAAHLFLQGTGSIGTTTTLSDLFGQNTLPTFSLGITAHFLIPAWSTWYYDGTYTANQTELKTGTLAAKDIPTTNAVGQIRKFRYRANFKEDVAKGDFKDARLYTFKTMMWLSATTKYDNSKYSFYDATKAFADQITSPLYKAWSEKITFNSYLFWNKTDVEWLTGLGGWRPDFIYVTGSLQYGLGNNINQLKKKTVNDISASYNNADNTVTRQVAKSQSAYAGIYKQYETLTPSFEILFSPIKSFAINVFGEHNFISDANQTKYNIKNYGSIATGIYFYGAGKSSSINIGAYYQWTNDNVTAAKIEQIGLKTTIPITPL